jgi:hypothetical protein
MLPPTYTDREEMFVEWKVVGGEGGATIQTVNGKTIAITLDPDVAQHMVEVQDMFLAVGHPFECFAYTGDWRSYEQCKRCGNLGGNAITIGEKGHENIHTFLCVPCVEEYDATDFPDDRVGAAIEEWSKTPIKRTQREYAPHVFKEEMALEWAVKTSKDGFIKVQTECGRSIAMCPDMDMANLIVDMQETYVACGAYVEEECLDLWRSKVAKKTGYDLRLFEEAPLQPDCVLAEIVGDKAITRTDAIMKLWIYIKKNGLLDSKKRNMINADKKLAAVFAGKKQVLMFEMIKRAGRHLK